MPFNEYIVDRIHQIFDEKKVEFELKKMFGGMCFMVDDKMCLGVDKDRLMVRLDPKIYAESLKRVGCVPMDFTGRPMKGFVFVEPEGMDADADLLHWIEKALEFNPLAKRSSKKKKVSS